MKTAFECRTGTILNLEGELMLVIKYDYKRWGRGSTTVYLRLKNLLNGSTANKMFDWADKLEDVHLTRKKFQYLYESAGSYTFMNQDTYEQIEINGEDLGDSANYLTEGMLVDIQEYEEKFIWVIMPTSVPLKVTETASGVKLNTVDGKTSFKEAKLETGITIMVPMFIEEGEMILVSTDTGEYMERVK